MAQDPKYDPRYLRGIELFNRRDYFGAHEVWEELWLDCDPADRRFYQSLIQAAVALYHWGNDNRTGARRLFGAGREKAWPYRPARLGLDVTAFWGQMEAALAGALDDRSVTTDPAAPPTIALASPDPE